MIGIGDTEEFLWDSGNRDKNLIRHDVHWQECEEAFFDEAKKIHPDPQHSRTEERYILLGKTFVGRLLFIIFTIRDKKIRVISARNLNKKELYLYEKET